MQSRSLSRWESRFAVAALTAAALTAAALLLAPAGLRADDPPADDQASARHFAERIKPLLESRCLSCHGPEEQEGGLRLDSRAAALKGGERGPAVVPAKPGDSLLLRSVKHEQHEWAMPPGEKLAAADVAALERWIWDGAPWPATTAIAPSPKPAPGERIGDAWSDPRNPIVRIFGGERLDLWSLRPVRRPELPAAESDGWSRRALDRFTLARRQADGQPPAPQAAPAALVRRLYFDLTGLPPAPEEAAEFGADERPDAHERLVDRLMASPRYGEQQARAWLDAIRYSDSNGFDWDEFRPQAWRLRDYVIRSLNADKPYDQFVMEQLAGDELLAGLPRSAADRDRLIATGYLRIGPQDNSSALFNEQARSRAELMNDLVETTGTAFLGLTFNCCRCHDHKYDPISHADYYRLRAFFEPVKYGDDLALDLAEEQDAINAHNAALDEQLAGPTAERAALLAAAKQRIAKDAAKAGEIGDDEARKAWTPEEQQQDKTLAAQCQALEANKRKLTRGLLMTDTTDEVPATKVHYQGDHKAERDEVFAGFLSALDPNAATIEPPPNPQTKGRRLALARWIASADNPLTARVLVNRHWQKLFGSGLVATPGDFGLAGDRPTDPQLLDHLASELVQRGWSLKTMHRGLVTSATYRQAATPRRLTAEQLRDALLFVAGLLHGKAEGPPVWPDLPSEVLTANPAFLDDNETKTKGWYPSPPHEQYARSIFQVQKRTVRVPFMETFDLPENMVSCSRRSISTVPPQALSLLNSPLAVAAARGLAARLESEAGGDADAQVSAAFRLALAREPTAEERAACTALVQAQGLVQFCRVVLNLNEFVYVD